MMKIKYNLKRILLEEDELDIVDMDTPLLDKWDKVPDKHVDDRGYFSKNHIKQEYLDDLFVNVRKQLRSYVYNNPDVMRETHPQYNRHVKTPEDAVRHYQSSGAYYLSNAFKEGDLVSHSRPGTWINNFHDFLNGKVDNGQEAFDEQYHDDKLFWWQYHDED